MSTLKPYPFPPFYACYLLKSLRTARSFKNYIGFTRNPIYRLQQHNGNCTGGARGTAFHRPWAMQLLIHGFPSLPAALLFEYAWQNPHKSRYTRDEAGFLLFEESGRNLGHNIMILQKMIRMFPFSKWPLHVKLFTKEAACYWIALASTSPASQFYVRSSDSKSITFGNELIENQARKNDEMQFPPGFTYSIELSGLWRSRRLLRINDRPYLAKTEALILLNQPILCSICADPVKHLAKDHFGTAVCTHADCTSVAHLQCLSKSWLKVERNSCSLPTSFSSNPSSSPSAHSSSVSSHHSSIHLPASALPASTTSISSSVLSSTRLSPSSSVLPASSLAEVPTPQSVRVGTKLPLDPHQRPISDPFGLDKGTYPRGGGCPSCGTYTLWGDIIQGCSSRSSTGRTAQKGRIMSHSRYQQRRTKNSDLKDSNSDSGAGSPCITHFDMLTLQDASRKRKSRSRSLLSRGKRPPRRRVLAQKEELDLARQSVEGYLRVIRSEQKLRKKVLFKPFKPGLLPRKRGRPRKIVRLTKTTSVLPLKMRGPGRPKKISDTPDVPLTKRGPGRPKKVLATTVVPAKPGPGKPKTILVTSVIPLIKRSPGRPKKALAIHIPLTKRSPGRPRKGLATTVVPLAKRGPGRPKKIIVASESPLRVSVATTPLKIRAPVKARKS